MNLDKKEFSKRFMDGKQAVMIQLKAIQRPDQFSFNARARTLSTGYWVNSRRKYERVIVYEKAERGGLARVWIGDDAGRTYDDVHQNWHYRARNVSAFTTSEDFESLFGVHAPQSICYLYPPQTQARTQSKNAHSSMRANIVDSDEVLKLPTDAATTIERLQKARLHQQKFRNRLFVRWSDACAVTGIEEPELLRASHIKPYRDCTARQCLSEHNGLLLVAGLDVLFDRGFITFDERGALVRSKLLRRETAAAFGVKSGMRLADALSDDGQTYMQHHRAEVFKK